jgi:GntR family transcriptional regulator
VISSDLPTREITMPVSKTQQLIDHIRRQIATSAWPPGHRLPSRQALMAEFGVSLTVVRDAQNYLRAVGELESVPGIGYFVPQRPPEG